MGILFWERPKPIAYDEIGSIAANDLRTVLEHGFDSDVFVSLAACSGTVYAEYSLWKDAVKIATKRSGPERNADFTFHWPLFFNKGSVIELKVIHYRADVTAKFEAGIFGHAN